MTRQARDLVVTGRVQGVGYRPFVYRLAGKLGLAGTVFNGSGKVFIHAEGAPRDLDRLEAALLAEAPPLARPRLASSTAVAPTGISGFEIRSSDAATEPEIHVPPDLFTCDDCLAELTGQDERRYGYPFINCTQCGPRYTIITAMPYDRPNTSMADFPLCDACRAEYETPGDRRFHAQPLACPVCGPRLQFVTVNRAVGGRGSAGGHARRQPGLASLPAAKPQRPLCACFAADSIAADSGSPLQQAVAVIEAGGIVAVKGVGGYHLVCDAASDDAVLRLRERKRRPHKPLAVMFPLRGADGLQALQEELRLDDVSAAAIADPARPIVLAPPRESCGLSRHLAPGLSELGAFLPYSPLHHQLLAALGRPVVATSGNLSGEPVITGNAEAQHRLRGIVDAFLHHDRPILRPADDPVLRPMAGRARTLRLGRGLAPLERELPRRLSRPVLATGGHMKVTVALAWDRRCVVSPHIGDLGNPRSDEIFTLVINDLSDLYDVKYQSIACDLHPAYRSTRWARAQDMPLIPVQHHAAHASALAGEHPDIDDWLVFTWDGVGYGGDGTLWGGEALAGRPGQWQRVASFRPFHLVGGDKAGREPWRSAAALLWETGAEADLASAAGARLLANLSLPGTNDRSRTRAGMEGVAVLPEAKKRRPDAAARSLLRTAHQAWMRRLNTFETTAAGRLFDAAAALVLGRTTSSFEGQGPMELEHVARDGCACMSLPLAPDAAGLLRSDWEPLLDVLTDGGIGRAERAGIFHESLAQALVDQAVAVFERGRCDAVGLSGGVFQNRRLTERVVAKLRAAGIPVRLHREIPANDGGLSFGQLIEATAVMQLL